MSDSNLNHRKLSFRWGAFFRPQLVWIGLSADIKPLLRDKVLKIHNLAFSFYAMSSYTFLLLIASAAHHVSSTPPSIAQKSSNHLLYSDKKTKVDEAASNSSHDALHGGKRFNQLGMMGVAGSKVNNTKKKDH